jgi:hypothetical protein
MGFELFVMAVGDTFHVPQQVKELQNRENIRA